VLKEELELAELFISQSVMSAAEESLEKTASQVKEAKATLQLTKSPEVAIGTQCYKPYPCDFIGHCWKNIPQNSILYLSSATLQQRFDWYNSNIKKPGQLENAELADQLSALEQQKLYLNQNQFANHLKSFDLSAPTFFKFLFHQPAVPELKGMKPYEPIVLAMCAFQPSNKTQQVYHWNCASAISDWKNVFQLLINLWESSGVFILHEDKVFNEFFNKNDDIFQEIKWINYADILPDSGFMIPSIDENPNQKLIQKHIFPEQKPLKEEAWLLKDLLDDPVKNSKKVSFQLEQYTKNLKEMHEFLISSTGL